MVVSDAQVMAGGVASGTVNIAEQVMSSAQSSDTVQVTVAVPPQKGGGGGISVVSDALHPPENEAEVLATHSLYMMSTSD